MRNDTTEIMDRLLGFDSRQFQRQMTDGLDEWCRRRRDAVKDRKVHKRVTCVMGLLVLGCWLAAPTRDYSLAEGVSYGEAEALTTEMLVLWRENTV